jgi:hypothetical protein
MSLISCHCAHAAPFLSLTQVDDRLEAIEKALQGLISRFDREADARKDEQRRVAQAAVWQRRSFREANDDAPEENV